MGNMDAPLIPPIYAGHLGKNVGRGKAKKKLKLEPLLCVQLSGRAMKGGQLNVAERGTILMNRCLVC